MTKQMKIFVIVPTAVLILAILLSGVYYISHINKNAETTNAQSEVKVEETTDQEDESIKPLVEDFKIEGVIGLDGSGNQSPLFTANSCRIVDSISGTTAVNCASCTSSAQTIADNKICIHPYSNLIRGPKAPNGQYFFFYSAEGGRGEVDIYFISSENSSLTLIDKLRLVGIPPFDEQTTIENTKYFEQTAKYNFEYYKDLTLHSDIESCKFPNENNPECIITIQLYDSSKCTAPTTTTFSTEFAKECFTNWDDLTQSLQKKLIENLQDSFK